MRQWSLTGVVERVINVSRKWANRAEVTATKFHGKHLAMTAHFPPLRQLPWPIQVLISQQVKQADDLEHQPHEIQPLGDKLSCKCLFYRKYLLPCKHIFWWEEHCGGFILPHHWDKWIFMFQNEVSGFEIYEDRSTEFIEEDIYQEIGAPARRKLEVKELLHATMQKYYDLERIIREEKWPDEQAQEVIQAWISLLSMSSGPVRQMGVEELKKQLSLESQAIVNESQRSCYSRKRPHGHLEGPAPRDEEHEDDLFGEDEFNADLEFIDELGALELEFDD